MAGSIRPRPDRGRDAWQLRVYTGRDAEGRVRHTSRIFRGSRRAAERELARMVAVQTLEPAVVPQGGARPWGPKTTINDAIAGWVENGWQDLSPSTVRRYRSMVKAHIEGSIGKRQIASLSPYDVELFFRSLKRKGLSEASVRQVRAVLHRACRLARKWSGNVLANPVSDTELPDWSMEEKGEVVRAPSATEVRRLLGAARTDPRLYAFVLLVAATGMRRGEACALRWSDVDLEKQTVVVDESAVVVDGGGVSVKRPKTRAGTRRMAIDTGTAAALADLLAQTKGLAALGGFAHEDSHFVFSFDPESAEPPYPDTFSHQFVRIRRKAGVGEDVHLHSLRHFQATALDAVISERQKQARLGWATVHMARHYTDGVEEEDRRAAEHVGRLLAGEDSRAPQVGQSRDAAPPQGS